MACLVLTRGMLPPPAQLAPLLLKPTGYETEAVAVRNESHSVKLVEFNGAGRL